MRLLVTRPEPDALLLKARLETLGHEATVAPLLSVSFDDTEMVDLAEVQAVIATSRNGLRGLKAQGAHRIAALLPLYAVGRATAKDGAALGFKDIITGAGRVADLMPEIVAGADPHEGVLLHLAGDELAGRMLDELELHGFRVLQPIVYRMVPTDAFTEDTVEQIATGEVEGVLLFSPRSASIYANLIVQHGLESAAQRLAHYCLSAAVAQRLAPLGPVQIAVADEPTLDGILEAVGPGEIAGD
jgi:uroporphyrinogen-III synthase